MSPLPSFSTPKLPVIPPISTAPVMPAPPKPPALTVPALPANPDAAPPLQTPHMQTTLAHQQHVAKCSEAATAGAEKFQKDDALARAKGNAFEQVEARQRVARLFCELHLPDDAPAQRDARLAAIDYQMPLAAINARGKDLSAPRSGRLFNFGRKPSYLVSTRFPPKTDAEPLYTLEYFAPKA